IARVSSRWTTTAASSVGARLKRPPGASIRSSASKISASSDVGRCCVIRPHMASLVSSAAMIEPGDDPFRDPALDAAFATQGPLTPEIARGLIARGRAKLEAGEAQLAALDFQRVVGHEDPAITGGALLGFGDVLYRLDNEPQAKAAWEAVTRLRENPSTYQAWRNLAAMRVRDGELNGAIEAYREADRRAPSDDKAEIAARLGWLAKETGNTGAANRYFARSRGSGGFGLSGIVIALTAVVSFIAFSSPDLFDRLAMVRS